jgi:hypothetical protein
MIDKSVTIINIINIMGYNIIKVDNIDLII